VAEVILPERSSIVSNRRLSSRLVPGGRNRAILGSPLIHKPCPGLGHPGQVVRSEASEQWRVLWQLSKCPENPRLRLRDDCRPSAASRWQKRWLERLLRLHLLPLPHPRRDPPRTSLPTAGKPLEPAAFLARMSASQHAPRPQRRYWWHPDGGRPSRSLKPRRNMRRRSPDMPCEQLLR
jgi:hypothetical protein